MSEIRLRRAENDPLRRDDTGPSANFYDEIIRLRAENERLRAGLQRIVDADGWWDAPSLARDLLEGKDVP